MKSHTSPFIIPLCIMFLAMMTSCSEDDDDIKIVTPVNRPPVWTSMPDSVAVLEDEWIKFTVEGEDPDGDSLFITFSSRDLPSVAFMFSDSGDGTGSFIWHTSFIDSGRYTAAFALSDGELVDKDSVLIHVIDLNLVPVWIEYPRLVEANVNELISFSVRAVDPEGGELVLTATSENLPGGWIFTDSGNGIGIFRWVPSYSEAGDYVLIIFADDGVAEIPVGVAIKVNDT